MDSAKQRAIYHAFLTGALIAGFLYAGGAAGDEDSSDDDLSFIRSEVLRTVYDGVSDDLLTGGLGKSGLQDPTPPTLSDPPTVAELRTLAIYNNYRALVDMTTGGGYGVLYGPNIDAEGNDTLGEGLVAGVEYLAFAGDRKGRENVTIAVQIPSSFDPDNPCIVTGTSSGSRGVYGAIGTSGDWGLKNRCAVAYADKGTGNGAHSMSRNTVNLIQGERIDADVAGQVSAFTAPISISDREGFDAERPNRYAYKHAHSRLNPEANWGRDVLRSIKFAFWALNEEYGSDDDDSSNDDSDDDGGRIRPGNTIVIASSVSNGAGAAILAAEQDREELIDGIGVSEPNVNPTFDPGFVIVQAGRDPVVRHSRSLYDYTSLLNLYQGCANAANPAAPLNLTDFFGGGLFGVTLSTERCQSLAGAGLLVTPDPVEAQARINEAGILVEQNAVQPSHWWVSVPQAIAVTYSNAYARAGVEDALCGFTFGATDGNNLLTAPGSGDPMALTESAEAALFGTGNGIPPTGGINVIYDDSLGGPKLDRYGISPATGRRDESFDGALCQRALFEGLDPQTGKSLSGNDRKAHRKLRRSIRQIRAKGDLDGRPAVIVTGRADAIIPPNHASRAYYGLNQRKEAARSGLRYYEITNAQHLDAFNAFAGFDNTYVPLHHYFIQGLDLLFAHLKGELPDLPPSQVVDTVPRGGAPGAAPPIDEVVNLPAIADTPALPIVFSGTELRIP